MVHDAGTGTGSGSLLYGLYLRRAALPLCRAGLGQKCIKAVAGLYILVVFADALPGAKAQFTALELPQVPAVSVGSLEDAVLAQTAEELSCMLEERCLSEAGVSLRLNISLRRTAEGVEATEVQIVLGTPPLPHRSGQ